MNTTNLPTTTSDYDSCFWPHVRTNLLANGALDANNEPTRNVVVDVSCITCNIPLNIKHILNVPGPMLPTTPAQETVEQLHNRRAVLWICGHLQCFSCYFTFKVHHSCTDFEDEDSESSTDQAQQHTTGRYKYTQCNHGPIPPIPLPMNLPIPSRLSINQVPLTAPENAEIVPEWCSHHLRGRDEWQLVQALDLILDPSHKTGYPKVPESSDHIRAEYNRFIQECEAAPEGSHLRMVGQAFDEYVKGINRCIRDRNESSPVGTQWVGTWYCLFQGWEEDARQVDEHRAMSCSLL